MIAIGDLVLDEKQGILERGASKVNVPGLASRALYLLMMKSGQPVAREQIIAAMYPDDATGRGDYNIVAVTISNVRAALDLLGIDRGLLRAVWGVGYTLKMGPPRILLPITQEQLDALDVLIAQAPPHVRRAAELLKGIGK